MEKSNIVDFFRNRSVFITGGTGFLGKVLIEKLLRCCPNIGNIYLLMRPKSGTDVQCRLQQLIGNYVFESLGAKHPESFAKLIPIAGDVTLPGLGISASDAKMLCDNVSIVFHSAATVKFNEELKSAVEMNLKGTKRVLELCHKMRQLEAFIHVSTAYANCDKEEILEKIYTPAVEPRKLIECVDWLQDDILHGITKQLIGGMPNTYAYTKGLTEYMLQEECGAIPLAIVRPSIVTAALQEPIPGWIDNLNGPTGFIAGVSKGLLRALRLDQNAVGDIIPVDFPINLMIAAAWYTATHKPNNIIVYNCSSGLHNPITWGQFKTCGVNAIHKNPTLDTMWYPSVSVQIHPVLHKLDAFIYHTIPAFLLDSVARLTGRRPKMMRLYERVERGTSSLEFFTTHGWKFAANNAMELSGKLSAKDQQMFYFDVRSIDWNDYLEKYILGTRQYVLKDDSSTLVAARKNLNRLYWLRQLTRMAGLIIFLLSWSRFVKRS